MFPCSWLFDKSLLQNVENCHRLYTASADILSDFHVNCCLPPDSGCIFIDKSLKFQKDLTFIVENNYSYD